MASVITHIALTEKVYPDHFSEIDEKNFYIGTCFADIRYIGVIDRDKTHFKNLTLNDLKDSDPFTAGLKFHSILDEVRENFLTSKGIYSEIENSRISIQALKSLEDQMLYDKIENWEQFTSYLDKPIDEERTFGVSDSDLIKWHKLIIDYLSSTPSNESRSLAYTKLGFSKDQIEEINILLSKHWMNPTIVKMINDLYNSFDLLLPK